MVLNKAFHDRMKILLVNKFLYPKGGDAVATLSTGKLLSERGHEVFYWGMDHPENPPYPHKELFVSCVDYNKPSGLFNQLKDGLNILYSFEAKAKMGTLLKRIRPDIIHLNIFAHQISPSILDVIKKHGIPVVMTMHEYKLVCPSYTMLLNGRLCERCKGGRYYNCFMGRCTKNSAVKSLVNTIEMYLHHNLLHIYDKIDVFISPSRFLMDKVQEMGFKGEIVHLPNFVDLAEFNPSYEWGNESILYAGRLSHEKGIKTLMDAVKGLNIKLKVLGDGPLKNELINKAKSQGINNVEFLGFKKYDELKKEVRSAMFAVQPSYWYENNPMSVLEAFAMGKPVIGSRIGGIPELVRDNETGFTFEPWNSKDLGKKIEYLASNKDMIISMGKNARALVENEYDSKRHYEGLISIYKRAME